MSEIKIRRARSSDACAICRINRASLGYDYDEAKTRENLARILESKGAVFTAELDGEACGYIHVYPYESTYHDPLANVMALAVDGPFRRHGVGKGLLEAAEKWAREAGYIGIRLDSGFERREAHRFYEACGYTHRKDHRNFIKRFDRLP